MNIYKLDYFSRSDAKVPIDERKSMSSMTNVIQNIVLENREKLNITGVLDVLSFDDQIVILETELGLLTVKGENLRINKLSLDTSEVTVDGEISQLAYSEKDTMEKGGGLLNKIFKYVIEWKNFIANYFVYSCLL